MSHDQETVATAYCILKGRQVQGFLIDGHFTCVKYSCHQKCQRKNIPTMGTIDQFPPIKTGTKPKYHKNPVIDPT